MTATHESTLDRAARERLGLALTSVQRDAVQASVQGRDTLVVSPTGSGKSAIYQLSGALLPGTTVVVSPLVALQDDQLDALRHRDVGGGVVVNSVRGRAAHREALAQIRRGDAEFVLLGPEQLVTPEVLDALREIDIDRLVVDEAHCVDAWGPDFRPDFLALGAVRAALGRPAVLALTATAAPHVREQIIATLAMREPAVIASSPERPNIHVGVHTHPDRASTHEAVLEEAVHAPGCGLIYVATRRGAEDLAAQLVERGRHSLAYHGSLAAARRATVHQAFRAGDDVVVVATSAFGLGIDKPDVRFVLHLDAPETIDAYYQEIGRAGRDGEFARASLHVTSGKPSGRRFSAGNSVPDLELCDAVVAADGATSLVRRSGRTGPRGELLQAVTLLEQHGLVDVHADLTFTTRPARWPRRRRDVAEALEHRRALLASRRQMVDQFVGSTTCRWATISGYLGEASSEQCGHCDRCELGGSAATGGRPSRPSQVEHPEFGAGTVMQESADRIVVLFEGAGYRTLSRAVVVEDNLLRAVGAEGERGPG